MVFERTFKEPGLSRVVRTDNGVPFAPARAIEGLSKLAVSLLLHWSRAVLESDRISSSICR